MRRTSFRRKKANRHVPWIMGLASLAMAVWLFSFMNWWQFLVGLLFLSFGWASVKTALFASDEEIHELTGGEMSSETKRKLMDRLP